MLAPDYFPRSLNIFLRVAVGVNCSSCSQILSTFQPRLLNSLVTSRSREVFFASFSRQNLRFVAGRFECLGHPCQKHPSTKTASLRVLKKKSGFPKSLGCLLQPLMPFRRSSVANIISVSLFSLPRMRDITQERFCLVKTSAILLHQFSEES